MDAAQGPVLPLRGTAEPSAAPTIAESSGTPVVGAVLGPVLPLLERYYRPGRAREPFPICFHTSTTQEKYVGAESVTV